MLGDACIRSKGLGAGSGKLDSSIFRTGNWQLSEKIAGFISNSLFSNTCKINGLFHVKFFKKDF